MKNTQGYSIIHVVINIMMRTWVFVNRTNLNDIKVIKITD